MSAVNLLRRHVVHAAVVLLLGLAPAAFANAQESSAARSEQIRQYIRLLGEHDKFMGAVTISIDGKELASAQTGIYSHSDASSAESNAETKFRVGSITKTFTAVMILQLVEEDKLSLDTPLAKFFPNIGDAENITIEHLLRHRSGLGSVTDDPSYRVWHTKAQTRDKMLELIAAQPKRFEPDERTQYSNTNYLLLGYIIEAVSEKTYGEELKTRIVDRLGLKHTGYATLADAERNVACSFRWNGKQWTPSSETHPSVPHGAGAIMSTSSDLVRFIEGLFAGELISKPTLDEMTSLVNRVGLGIMRMRAGETPGFGHHGGIDGFRSTVQYYPEDKIAFAVVGNGFNYSSNDIISALARIAFDLEFEMPSLEAFDVPVETLKGYEGNYASDEIPMKITIKVDDQTLTAQATGQPAIPLTASSSVDFAFDAVGVKISFDESAKESGVDSFTLRQAGREIRFSKEK